jgi:hypothetical protein
MLLLIPVLVVIFGILLRIIFVYPFSELGI